MCGPHDPHVLMATSSTSLMAAPPELLRLYPDALRDAYAAAYALVVVAPVTTVASRLLLYRGKKTTPVQVYLVSLAVPTLAMWLPTVDAHRPRIVL